MGFLFPIRAGVETLEDLLDAIDVVEDADIHDWKQWKRVADYIREVYQPGDQVVFIGHSEGAKVAVDAASYLEGYRIPVDLIVGIDPTLNKIPPMPRSVRRVAEYHATSGIVALFRKLSGGRIGCYNYPANWPGKKDPIWVENGGHIPVSKDSDVHKDIVPKVVAALV